MLFRLFSPVAGICLCLAPATRAALDTVTTTADSGLGSLRNTIAAAGSGDTIVFSPTLAGHIIYLTSGELLIRQNVTIDASALLPGAIAINGSGISRVMEIGSGTFVSLNALTVTNGFANGDPGAGVLLDDATCSLTADNCVFRGNSGDDYGGAICAYGALALNNCVVSGNSASVFGGGIFGYGGPVTLNNCTLFGNAVSDGGGGGVENEFGTLTLNNCTVSSNFATAFGGGVDAEDEGSLALTNCVFTGNSSETAGALSAETTATADSCVFSNNVSTNSTGGTGGGIVNYETMTLYNCTLAGNSVNNGGSGGGMVNSGILMLNNCTLSGNRASNGNGSGIYIEPVTTNILVNCTICSNSAAGGSGGGIFSGGNALLTNTIVAGNAAATGADVYGSYSGPANFVGGNQELAALGNYGGPTPTMPPLVGSPVIDTGTDWVTNFLAADQRGYPRLAGAHVDIGAVEAQIAPANNRPVLSPAWLSGGGGRGSFRFTFKSATNSDFTVLSSTNLELPLAGWTVLGNAPQYAPGKFQFSDALATNNARFYDVVSP